MSAERGRSEMALKPSARWRAWFAPCWLLRLRLQWTVAEVARLEAELAAEFALQETAPMQSELQALRARRDALVMRLALSC